MHVTHLQVKEPLNLEFELQIQRVRQTGLDFKNSLSVGRLDSSWISQPKVRNFLKHCPLILVSIWLKGSCKYSSACK